MSERNARDRFRGRLVAGVLLLIVCQLPVWLLDHFPTQDGPSHLSTAVGLAQLESGTNPELGAFFEANWRIQTNQLAAIFLRTMVELVPPATAEKLLVALIVVLFPLALFYLLSSRGAPHTFVLILALPLIFMKVVHLGFYNYVIGLILLCFSLGYYLRYCERLRPVHLVCLAFLLLATYFAHVAAAAHAAIFVAALMTARLIVHAPRRDDQVRPRGAAAFVAGQRGAVLLLCAIVVAAAVVVHLDLLRPVFQAVDLSLGTLGKKVLHLAAASFLVSFGVQDFLFGLVFNAVLLGFVVICMWRDASGEGRLHDPDVCIAILILVSAYAVMPFQYYLTDRFMPLIYIGLLLWLGTARLSQALRRWFTTASVALCLAAVAYRLPVLLELDEQLAEYISVAGRIEQGRTLYALEDPFPKPKVTLDHLAGLLGLARGASGAAPGNDPFAFVDPLRNAEEYVAIASEAVSLSNYQARFAFFPLRIRPGRDPYPYLRLDPESAPEGRANAPFDLEAYEAVPGNRIDYILVRTDFYRDMGDFAAGRTALRTLESRYRLAYVSRPRGLLRVYRRKPE